jgi:hypothetical protein
MNRAQPKSSPTDQHARSIAAAIAKGWPPALTPELDQYFESSPRDIFVAFEGVARHMPPGGHDETLVGRARPQSWQSARCVPRPSDTRSPFLLPHSSSFPRFTAGVTRKEKPRTRSILRGFKLGSLRQRS